MSSMEELARRAVACGGWNLMRGMGGTSVIVGCYLTLAHDAQGWLVYKTPSGITHYVVDDFLPDLSDPATLGCILALVREAWGCYVDVVATMQRNGRQYKAFTPDGGFMFDWSSSEAEALIVALEARP